MTADTATGGLDDVPNERGGDEGVDGVAAGAQYRRSRIGFELIPPATAPIASIASAGDRAFGRARGRLLEVSSSADVAGVTATVHGLCQGGTVSSQIEAEYAWTAGMEGAAAWDVDRAWR